MASSFQCYADHSPHALAIVNAANAVEYANNAFSSLFRHAANPVEGCSLATLLLPTALAPILMEGLDTARSTAKEHRFTLDNDMEPNQPRWSCRLIPLKQDALVIVEFNQLPETEKLRESLKAERCLRHKSDLLRKRGRKLFFDVIDELPVFVYMQRRDYTVAYANKKTKIGRAHV